MSLELLYFIGHALAAALCFLAGVHFARWRFVVAALKLRHERERMNREERQAKAAPVNLYPKADDAEAPN